MEKLLMKVRAAEALIQNAEKALESIDINPALAMLEECRELRMRQDAVKERLTQLKLSLIRKLLRTANNVAFPGQNIPLPSFEGYEIYWGSSYVGTAKRIRGHSERKNIRPEYFASAKEYAGMYWHLCAYGIQILHQFIEQAQDNSYSEDQIKKVQTFLEECRELKEMTGAAD